MKRIYILILSVFALVSCHESIDDRLTREAKEYTRKNCPAKIAEDVSCDSMTYDRSNRVVSYHYTLTGHLDTTFTKEQQEHAKAEFLNGIRNATNLKMYKEEGIAFRYVYNSKKDPSKVLFDHTFTEKQYNSLDK